MCLAPGPQHSDAGDLFVPVLSGHSKKTKLGFKTDYRLMQVKSIAGEHSAILSIFIKLTICH